MLQRVGQTARAALVVFISMSLGVAVGLTYVTLHPVLRAPGGALLPVRMEAPLSAQGEASKADLFDERQVMEVYERAAPAVVAIFSRTGGRQGLGSGVLIEPTGVVLTNYHVVRNASQIEVILSDHSRYTGQVLGGDPQNDLAVVRLLDAPGNLPTVELGELQDIKPGSLAVAIGNPNGLERSVTVGVVSGMNRTLRDTPARAPIRDVIQTDAAINQGNSGGPLLNRRGELIGINTAIEVVNGQRGFGGIGFAVPVTTATRYLDQMMAGQTIEHPWLGISGGDVTAAIVRERGLTAREGVLIEEAVSESPAEKAGIQRNDVITAINGRAIRNMDELGARLDREHNAGEMVTFNVARGREKLDLQVRLGSWPERLPPTR